MRALWLSMLAGCAGPIEGTWIGPLECGGFDFDWEMSIAKDEGRTYTGEGVQQREFVNTQGQTVEEVTEFSVSLTMDGGGAQDLQTDLACTTYVQAVVPPGGGDRTILADECVPLTYKDWIISWDGEKSMSIEGAKTGCAGTLTLR